ncbi:MAG: glutaredoxin family protein [Thiogranum sp.]|nr:glutaredoxin family protein [Thiogranum sp.]
MTVQPAQLTLYYREGCHLCDSMLQALRGLQSCLGFELEVLDIDRDPQLRQRYDEWVPVLCDRDREICHYHLDENRLRAAVEAAAQAPAGSASGSAAE